MLQGRVQELKHQKVDIHNQLKEQKKLLEKQKNDILKQKDDILKQTGTIAKEIHVLHQLFIKNLDAMGGIYEKISDLRIN